MGGTRCTNTWMTLWLMTMMTQLSCVQPWAERSENEFLRHEESLMKGNCQGVASSRVRWGHSIPVTFFVTLAKHMGSNREQMLTGPETCSVITADNLVTSRGTVPCHQQQRPAGGATMCSKTPPAVASHRSDGAHSVGGATQVTTEKVEYTEGRDYEFEQNLSTVKSRLKNHVLFWENVLKAPSVIINTIKDGYRIPFARDPCSNSLKINRSALNNADFVTEAIIELLKAGCIKKVKQPFVSNPLTVSINSAGKKRLVLDLRHVNQYVEKMKVKFEGVHEALNYAKQGHYMCKFDLKSGYHHIDIHTEHQNFLGFSWKNGNEVVFYQFSVLPFGLSSAGHIFCKVVRVLVKYWRMHGIPIVVYLDDGWWCAEKAECLEMSKFVKESIMNSGFLPNFEKSQFNPTIQIEWLGFLWNLENGSLEVPRKKLVSILKKVDAFKNKKFILTARNVASVEGKIISFKPALGSICQLMTRHLSMFICQRDNWDARVSISNEWKNELIFWSESLQDIPCNHVSKIYSTPERILFTDASGFAGAGFMLGSDKNIVHFFFFFIQILIPQHFDILIFIDL
ncbi:uncharacterized protein LOC110447257 isoform X1 [Mizuhopecten yessoensis]|uniref:uncharacterized protein LOC110447257 isoform X1 n=1 Tax=Mizuhopecten yessoensis TaxID=6573 RepID=UPI000B4572F3|nr:uncharacterized protein LOC110447257 isoform X1 [Mizuhopecten yessoensis]XP_021348505.1 uncharacterized protein LOC110447257 isoform X1 [Mizuhopecten yessoensis]